MHLEVDEIASLPLFENTLALSFSEYNQAESQKFAALLRYFIPCCYQRNLNTAIAGTDASRKIANLITPRHTVAHLLQ